MFFMEAQEDKVYWERWSVSVVVARRPLPPASSDANSKKWYQLMHLHFISILSRN